MLPEVHPGRPGPRRSGDPSGPVIALSPSGRSGGSRTPNLRFWRPTLYQLSYAPPEADAADHTGPAARLSCIIPAPFASTQKRPDHACPGRPLTGAASPCTTGKIHDLPRLAAECSTDMAPPLLQLKDIALTFGGTPLLTGAELSVSPAERVSLIGRNGSGKSTLLRIAAGLTEPDRGTVFVQPGALVRYLPQEPDFSGFATTRAYVEAGLKPTDDPYTARYLLEQLGLTGDEDPAHLSGGEARRASLARVLAPSPDILLLDEPTNHLDLPVIEWLEAELGASRGALVIISHDRRFLGNLTRSTVWLDRGVTRRIERGFAHFEEWRDQLLAEEEREQHKLDRKIAAEEDWMRYGVT